MMRLAYETPPMPCPYCGESCEADWCDVGVGMVQCGPYHCIACHASEIGPYDEERPLSADEKRTGWYAPSAEPGSSANVIDGKIVDHRTARDVYRSTYPLMATEQGREWMRRPTEAGPSNTTKVTSDD